MNLQNQVSKKRVWKKHKLREQFDECPNCGKPLRWIYIEREWYPCSHEPVIFILHPEGKNTVVYKKELFEKALIYKKDDKRFENVQAMQGYIQHYYDCPVLRQERREWAKIHYENNELIF